MFINLCEPISAVEKSPYSGMQYMDKVNHVLVPHILHFSSCFSPCLLVAGVKQIDEG